MKKIERQTLINYFHIKELLPTELKAQLAATLGESASSFTTVKTWFAEFKRGRTSTHDAPRSGRQKTAPSEEMVHTIKKLVLKDRRLKLEEIAETVGISAAAKH
jgi:transposase